MPRLHCRGLLARSIGGAFFFLLFLLEFTSLRAAAQSPYVDNGDGTITDQGSGLMWEKLSDDGTVHDQDNTYSWEAAVTDKIARLNNGSGFAGYKDWRLPSRNELKSIVDPRHQAPAVSPAFNAACTSGCTVTSCSCAVSGYYWSSSTDADNSKGAWFVDFKDGSVGSTTKWGLNYVRAVRGQG